MNSGRLVIVGPDRVWKTIAGVALVALGVSLGLNIVIMSGRFANTPLRPIVTEKLPLGTKVLPIEARTTDGNKLRIDSGGARATILYFFSTSCGWCERNWANVHALASSTRGTYEFIGVSNSPDTGEFAHEMGLPFRCVTGVPDDVLGRIHVGGTPRTIALSREGRVIGDWIGAYTPKTQQEIEQFFSTKLPGLVAGEPSPSPADGRAGPRGESAPTR